MFEPLTSRRKLEKVSACRRQQGRAKVETSNITCWSDSDSPLRVPAIEADVKGARLMLPWDVQPGEHISVSVGNSVGLYHTRNARIVWTQKLEVTGRVVAGVAFDYELPQAV